MEDAELLNVHSLIWEERKTGREGRREGEKKKEKKETEKKRKQSTSLSLEVIKIRMKRLKLDH